MDGIEYSWTLEGTKKLLKANKRYMDKWMAKVNKVRKSKIKNRKKAARGKYGLDEFKIKWGWKFIKPEFMTIVMG